ncbi:MULTISPECIES: hypothetical protein [unclassified Blastococcus]
MELLVQCGDPRLLDGDGLLQGHDVPELLQVLLAEDQVWVTLSGLERLLPAGVEAEAGGAAFAEA